MNKLFRLIGFVFLFLILFLIVLGVYSSSDVEIRHTYHLQAPPTLIWQHITDSSNSSDWINQFPIKLSKMDSSSGVIACFADIDAHNKISTIIPNETDRSIELNLEPSWYNPYIDAYAMSMNIKPLRDGTTEINCQVQYHLKNLAAKIANKLFYEGWQKNLLEQNLESLHKYFEKV